MGKVNTRQKGKELERYVADQIRQKGLDLRAYARSDSGGGNKEKTDVTTSMMILDKNAGIECKNHKNASVQMWWSQTEKLDSLGYEPILVYSLFREQLSESKTIIRLDTLLELIKLSQGINKVVEVNATPKEALFHIERSRYHVKQALKSLGESE